MISTEIKPRRDSSANPDIQELYRKFGIIHINTTREHLGKSSIIILSSLTDAGVKKKAAKKK